MALPPTDFTLADVYEAGGPAAAVLADSDLAVCFATTWAGEEPSAEPSGGGVPGESAQHEGHGEHLRVASCSAAAAVSG